MKQSWIDFLRLVLPPNGTTDKPHQYCIGHGVDGPTQEAFLGSLEDVATVADQLQAKGPINGSVYFSVSALQIQPQGSKQERKQQHGLGNKTLLLDIDIRKNRPDHYDDLFTAIRSLFTICANDGLPQPSVVMHSGQGAHVYWALDEVIPGEDYRAFGSALTDFIKQRDPLLVADTKPSKNNVTYIRMPGSTNNRVTPPHVVGYYAPNGAALGNAQEYPLSVFENLFQLTRVASSGSNTSTVRQINPMSGQSTARNIDPIEPLQTAQDYYTGCAVMRHLYDNQSAQPTSKDYVGYEAWRPMIALLARTGDAHSAVHAWSRHAPTYAAADVDKQLRIEQQNQLQMTGPISCEQLCANVSVGRTLCSGCPMFKPNGGTPYRAAKQVETDRTIAAAAKAKTYVAPALEPSQDTAPQAAATTTHAHNEASDADYDAELDTIIHAQEDSTQIASWVNIKNMVENEKYVPFDNLGIPKDHSLWSGNEFPLKIGAAGELIATIDDGAGNQTDQFVANAVLWPLRYVQVQDSDRSNVQVCVAKYEDNQWYGRVATMSYDVVGGRAEKFKQEVSGLQVVLDYSPKLQALFHRWFTERTAKLKAADALTLFTKFGWTEDADGQTFTVGPYSIRPGGRVQVATLGAETKQLAAQHFKLCGSFEGAASVIDFLWRHGTDEAKMALLLGVGAPMTYKSSTGGAYVNLWGDNGSGKSLLANIICGIWGDGSRTSAHITTKDTVNYRYSVLSAFSSLPVVHDEATKLHKTINIDPEMGQYLYDISEGKGKGRAVKTGVAAAVRNWRTVVIATSNACIRDEYDGMSDMRSAQLARAYEININKPIIQGVSPAQRNRRMETLGNAMNASSGVAGLALAQYYVMQRQPLEAFMEAYMAHATKTETKTDADTRVRRAIRSIASVGGKALIETGLCPSADMQSVMDLVERVDRNVVSSNKASSKNPLDVLYELMNSLTEYTAHVKTTPQGVASITAGARNATSSADGVRNEPKFHLRMRIDETAGLDRITVSVKGEVFREYMKRRNIDPKNMVRDLARLGFPIRQENVNIQANVKMPSRGDFGSEGVMPPVPCVVFELKTAATQSANGATAILPAADQLQGKVA